MDSFFNSICGSNAACDTVGVWLGAVLTLLVLSFLIKDTWLFRLASSLLVGTAVGYGAAVVLRTVLWEQLARPLLADLPESFANTWPLFIPLLLGLLLLGKLVPGWSGLGNLSLGYLFGVGAALAIGGALSGALVPQLGATIVPLSPALGIDRLVNNLLVVIGTLGTLLAFRFTTSVRTRPLRVYSALAQGWGRIGRAFMMVALGAIFANTLTARVSVLVGQMYFLLHDWLGIVR